MAQKQNIQQIKVEKGGENDPKLLMRLAAAGVLNRYNKATAASERSTARIFAGFVVRKAGSDGFFYVESVVGSYALIYQISYSPAFKGFKRIINSGEVVDTDMLEIAEFSEPTDSKMALSQAVADCFLSPNTTRDLTPQEAPVIGPDTTQQESLSDAQKSLARLLGAKHVK